MLNLFLIMLLIVSNVATAEIFKCVAKNGKVSYSQHVCSETATSGVFQPNLGVFKPQPDVTQPSSATWQLPAIRVPAFSGRWMLVVYALMSAICYVCYWFDKRAAENGRWRISEKSLHTLELLGGWPGALLAQHRLRHKTRKLSYQMVFWLIICLHVVVWLDHFALNDAVLTRLKTYLH